MDSCGHGHGGTETEIEGRGGSGGCRGESEALEICYCFEGKMECVEFIYR